MRLNEKQAWVFLANSVTHNLHPSRSYETRKEYKFLVCNNRCSYGLCYAIRILMEEKKISNRTKDIMFAKVKNYNHGKCKEGYIWGHTKRSHKLRAAFCNKMANNCK